MMITIICDRENKAIKGYHKLKFLCCCPLWSLKIFFF